MTRDVVEEEVRGRTVVGSVSEGACALDFEDPLFRRGELVAAAVLVEECEAGHAYESGDADLLVGEVALENSG